MPILNNVEYLSLPQQVEKNKDDIELLKQEVESLKSQLLELTLVVDALVNN